MVASEKKLDQVEMAKYQATMQQSLLIFVTCAIILSCVLLTNLFFPTPIRDQFVPIALCACAIYISRREYLKAKSKLDSFIP